MEWSGRSRDFPRLAGPSRRCSQIFGWVCFTSCRMGQAVLSFPQFQDLEPNKAITLFSDLFDLKIEWILSEWCKRAQTSRPSRPINWQFHFNVTYCYFSSYFFWARTWVNALESTPFRLIVTKFNWKYYGLGGAVVAITTAYRYFHFFLELS